MFKNKIDKLLPKEVAPQPGALESPGIPVKHRLLSFDPVPNFACVGTTAQECSFLASI